MISLRQLHYFVEIVESGGFSRAAERLFVAQSALSRQVRELEDSIGTPPVSYTHLARFCHSLNERSSTINAAFIFIPKLASETMKPQKCCEISTAPRNRHFSLKSCHDN